MLKPTPLRWLGCLAFLSIFVPLLVRAGPESAYGPFYVVVVSSTCLIMVVMLGELLIRRARWRRKHELPARTFWPHLWFGLSVVGFLLWCTGAHWISGLLAGILAIISLGIFLQRWWEDRKVGRRLEAGRNETEGGG